MLFVIVLFELLAILVPMLLLVPFVVMVFSWMLLSRLFDISIPKLPDVVPFALIVFCWMLLLFELESMNVP